MATTTATDMLWQQLQEAVLDLGRSEDEPAQRVSVSASRLIVSGMIVTASTIMVRGGVEWLVVHLAEADGERDRARLMFARGELAQVGWVEDSSQPERECLGVLDRDGREVLIVLEREQ